MIDKDSISLLRSRRTKSLSIIVMDVSYPLDEKIQEGFDKIARISDVFLLFNDNCWIGSESIDKMKFACLHDCLGWISVKNTTSESLLKVLNYTTTISEASNFLFYSIIKCSGLSNLTDEMLSTLKSYHISNVINKPILKLKRLSPKELHRFYQLPTKPKSNKLVEVINRLKDKITNKSNKNSNIARFDYTNAHCTHKSDSWFVVMKIHTINTILEFFKKDENKEYPKTFKEPDPLIFLSSVLVKLNIDIINSDLSKVKINGNSLSIEK